LYKAVIHSLAWELTAFLELAAVIDALKAPTKLSLQFELRFQADGFGLLELDPLPILMLILTLPDDLADPPALAFPEADPEVLTPVDPDVLTPVDPPKDPPILTDPPVLTPVDPEVLTPVDPPILTDPPVLTPADPDVLADPEALAPDDPPILTPPTLTDEPPTLTDPVPALTDPEALLATLADPPTLTDPEVLADPEADPPTLADPPTEPPTFRACKFLNLFLAGVAGVAALQSWAVWDKFAIKTAAAVETLVDDHNL